LTIAATASRRCFAPFPAGKKFDFAGFFLLESRFASFQPVTLFEAAFQALPEWTGIYGRIAWRRAEEFLRSAVCANSRPGASFQKLNRRSGSEFKAY
jgi:hypothetical protein